MNNSNVQRNEEFQWVVTKYEIQVELLEFKCTITYMNNSLYRSTEVEFEVKINFSN